MPNLISLTSECFPARLSATVVTVMFCGVPLGGTMDGLISAWLLPIFGWQSAFYVGGIVPLVLAIALWFWLPESVRFLIASGTPVDRIRREVKNLAPRAKLDGQIFRLAEEKIARASVVRLFAKGRAAQTLLVWLAFFANLLVMYFLVNWLPTIARDAGLPINLVILSTALFNLGGVVGGVVLGRLFDGAGPFAVLSYAYFIAVVATAVVACAEPNIAIILSFVFVVGAGIIGAQIGINALTAEIYPTAIRSSGVGWALGIGRIGLIVGPVFGGFLIAGGIGSSSVLHISAIPALIAASAVVAFGMLRRGTPKTLAAQMI